MKDLKLYPTGNVGWLTLWGKEGKRVGQKKQWPEYQALDQFLPLTGMSPGANEHCIWKVPWWARSLARSRSFYYVCVKVCMRVRAHVPAKGQP